jgi:hypothetical protein
MMPKTSQFTLRILFLLLSLKLFFIPLSIFSQTLTAEKLIDGFMVSDVYQTKIFSDLSRDLVSNFNEKRFNLRVKEIRKYLSNHDENRLKARLFIYERFAYQKMAKSDTLNTPANYLKIINLVTPLGDEQLLSELYCKYAAICDSDKKLYYLLKCIEIRERIGLNYFTDISSNYYSASEQLYKITDYKSSASYATRGISLYTHKERQDFLFHYILATDIAGASYLKINQPDSAIYYYTHIANLINDRLAHPNKYKSPMNSETLQIWRGVVNGGIGKAYLLKKKYDEGYTLLTKNLKSSTNFKQWNDVADVLNSLAKIDQKRHNISLALSRYRQAYHYSVQSSNLPTLITAAEGVSSCFAKQEKYDSAYIYHKKYMHWKELVDNNLNQSRLAITKAQLDFEKMQKNLQQSQTNLLNLKRIRNAILIGIVLLTAIALLLYNRKRLRMSLQNEQLKKARHKSETERIFAQKQIDQFINNIAEKNKLIKQLQNKMVDTDNLEVNAALSDFVILTEEDWQQFKVNFETINPNYLKRLKQKMPQITQGEQRIILLAKLGFNTKKMANATGVSPETIRSVSSRLRKKFNLNADLQTIANEI